MRAGVVVFPGSNCDRDALVAVRAIPGAEAISVWHADTTLPDRLDLLILPGGFSYGDYLRSGAMAARAPVMDAVDAAATAGVPLIGICNGFQVLTERGLLPGALTRNRNLRFVCRPEPLIVGEATTPFTRGYRAGERVTFPVAHHDGCYIADEATLDRLEGEGRIAFRYAENPNGSARDIAGIASADGRILGLMPHPERAVDADHGGTDGRRVFEAALGLVAA